MENSTEPKKKSPAKVILALIAAAGLILGLMINLGVFDRLKTPGTEQETTQEATTEAIPDGTLRLVTGGMGGSYEAEGERIARLVNENTAVELLPAVGNGSEANLRELADGTAQLALCRSDAAHYAETGTKLFAGKKTEFTVLGTLFSQPVMLVTTDAELTDVAMLTGKRIAVGYKESEIWYAAQDVLSAAGLTEETVDLTESSLGESIEDLLNGKTDAAFFIGDPDDPEIRELSARGGAVTFIRINGELLETLLSRHSYYGRCETDGGESLCVDLLLTAGPGVSDAAKRAIGNAVFGTGETSEAPGETISEN